MRSRLREEKGFTLLEIMVVLMIFCLSVSLIFPSILSGIGKAGLRSTTRKMAASLKYSRNRALRERNVYYAEASGDRLLIKAADREAPEREVVTTGDMEVSSENGVISFYPGGGSSGGLLKVRSLKNSSLYTIKVEPSTGKVSVSRLLS
ncbi:MAG: Tfp pilus assembly protein FimT/FimU [Thermodesulfobacteriota bacterium]